MSTVENSMLESQPPSSFRLKAGLFPLTLLEVQGLDRQSFERELQLKVAEAPAFFQQTPVILSFDADARGDMSLAELVELCRTQGLVPVVLRGGSEELQQQALQQGLALMPEGRSRAAKAEPEPSPAEDVPEPAAPAAEDEPSAPVPGGGGNRVITTPIRSGQQVYAAGGDLIVLSSVSAGAEVLADGNIHVYGPLRGRALAGVRGDTGARIFCQSLEAELISIAGDFQLSDDLRGKLWKQPVQICLSDQKLTVEPLA
ncbi:septum site-determining protein MinC [Pseudomaricurvus sp. HS19]|uniref:septum site-determining protein MinC n=1 Tax=Pseudomaricurvus sp. HS19 TaxID=2692626 RepID=UPI00136AA3D9|nr:septum site-determining protein MinC [Pseudomaricurvus sp. HS19]MYM64836.1 septum site-determining protein MinC [Pseudomaricurvus sp. HS19]